MQGKLQSNGYMGKKDTRLSGVEMKEKKEVKSLKVHYANGFTGL